MQQQTQFNYAAFSTNPAQKNKTKPARRNAKRRNTIVYLDTIYSSNTSNRQGEN